MYLSHLRSNNKKAYFNPPSSPCDKCGDVEKAEAAEKEEKDAMANPANALEEGEDYHVVSRGNAPYVEVGPAWFRAPTRGRCRRKALW